MSDAVLLCVGLGYRAGAQVTPEAQSILRDARYVLYLTSDPVTAVWLQGLNPTACSLHHYYVEGVHGGSAAREMVARIVAAVRIGGTVCLALDGHPAIYSNIALEAMRQVRAEGYDADMLPGVSALDCLYATAGLDPGRWGCQLFEATDFLRRHCVIDTHTPLILLQVGVVGVTDYRSGAEGDRDGVRTLSQRLVEIYGAEHELLLYEMAALPFLEPRLERISSSRLACARVAVNATLYAPPLAPPVVDEHRMARLGVAFRAGRLVSLGS